MLPVSFPFFSGAASDEKAEARRAERESLDQKRADALIKRVRSSSAPLPVAWNDIFRTSQVSGTVLATAFLKLHEAKDYETCIEGLLAAIRNDHGQPWMYDVLALQMSLAKRPEKEINRVLLSRVDFTDGNEAQMLVTASMLSQFGDYNQALSICREATKRNPRQIAAWTMARSIADRSNDRDAIAWSRLGTLKHAWDFTYEEDHAEARTVLNELLAGLVKAGDKDRAAQLENDIYEAAQRDLTIQISWAGNADLDLVVEEPRGQTCSYKSSITANGGILVRQGDGASRGQTEIYVCAAAPSGDYVVRIKNVLGRLITGKVRVQIKRYSGTDKEQTQTAFYELGASELAIKVPLKGGRAR